ncbi:MAG: hypothetical protein KC483_00920 [Nitrosarchaeum sp.]|nr:hypothetical protein [Nitrosarchaeum sp.]MCA9819391.1 hypothetical protein [Nitrosarchaeum sp.]
MKFYPTKLLTITCEILAKKNILDIFTKYSVTGYTSYEVEGRGSRGLRGQGLENEKNIKVEVVISEEKLHDVVEEIARTMFTDFAIMLYVSEIGILRTEKFS